MKLLGIAGSLRKGSYNRSLLRAARELLPEGVELVDCEIGGLPFYDGDVEAAGDPEPVDGPSQDELTAGTRRRASATADAGTVWPKGASIGTTVTP